MSCNINNGSRSVTQSQQEYTVQTHKMKVLQITLILSLHAWSKWDVGKVATAPSPSPSVSAIHLSTAAWLWNVMFSSAGCCSHGSPSTWTGVIAFSLIYKAQSWPCEIWSCQSLADKNFHIIDMVPHDWDTGTKVSDELAVSSFSIVKEE
jgi:hypothetical protein